MSEDKRCYFCGEVILPGQLGTINGQYACAQCFACPSKRPSPNRRDLLKAAIGVPICYKAAFLRTKPNRRRIPEWRRMYEICELEEVSKPTQILLGPAMWADLQRSVQSLTDKPIRLKQFRYRTADVEYDASVPQRIKAILVGPKPNSKGSWVRVFYDIDEVG